MKIKEGSKVVLKDGRFLSVFKIDDNGVVFRGRLGHSYVQFAEDDVLHVVEITESSDELIQGMIDAEKNRVPHSFAVTEEGEPEMIHVISFTAKDKMTVAEALALFRLATTKWVIGTIEGRSKFMDSPTGKLDLTDLLPHIEDPMMIVELARVGIQGARINTMEALREWNGNTYLTLADEIGDIDEKSKGLQTTPEEPPEIPEDIDDNAQILDGRNDNAES